jgi:hypothetical protein
MRIVAVIGREYPDRECSRLMVLLEIGYNRTRPYQQIESRHFTAINGSGRWTIKGRRKLRQILDWEMMRVYDFIVLCMADIVLECREVWKKKDEWFVPGVGFIRKGIDFTFDKDDASLCRHMVFEDIRYRQTEYIERHTRCIRYWLRRYKHSYYSDRQLRSFNGVRKVADLIRQSYSDALHREKLFDLVSQKSIHHRGILDGILSAFRLPVCNEDIDAYLGERNDILPWMTILHCRRIFDQPETHAKNCLVFEIILEDMFRKGNEVPF